MSNPFVCLETLAVFEIFMLSNVGDILVLCTFFWGKELSVEVHKSVTSSESLQPAIYVTSLVAVELLRACDGGQQIIDSVDVTCGLSLGE